LRELKRELFVWCDAQFSASTCKMTNADILRLLSALDSNLQIFADYDGRLSSKEVRLRSLLSLVRSELVIELDARTSSRDHEADCRITFPA
jgi:hypothetical protein